MAYNRPQTLIRPDVRVGSNSGSGGISRTCPLFPAPDIRRSERHVGFVPAKRHRAFGALCARPQASPFLCRRSFNAALSSIAAATVTLYVHLRFGFVSS